MSKMKSAGLLVALLSVTIAAFKSAQQDPCWYRPQYYQVGNSYYLAGELGVDYYCALSINTCTWYRPNPVTQPNYYLPCQSGTYTVIPPLTGK